MKDIHNRETQEPFDFDQTSDINLAYPKDDKDNLCEVKGIKNHGHEQCSTNASPLANADMLLVPSGTVPEFPVDLLPEPVSRYIKELSESLQVPVDVAASCALGLLAGVFQSRFVLEYKKEWIEPLGLYQLVITPLGDTYNLLVGNLANPLQKHESAKKDKEKIILMELEAKRRLLAKYIQQLEAKAAKEEPDQNEIKDEYLRKTAELAEFIVPPAYRLLLSNNSGSSLLQSIAEQKKGVVYIGAKQQMMQTSKRQMNPFIIMNIYDGKFSTSSTPNGINHVVDNPRLTMILNGTPDVIPDIKFAKPETRNMFTRYLYVISNPGIGYRNFERSTVSIGTLQDYEQYFLSRLDSTTSGVLRLSQSAHAYLTEYIKHTENLLRKELSYMVGWGARIIHHVLRISGILHCACADRDTIPTEIDDKTMQAAIKCTEFYRHHAMIAYGHADQIRFEEQLKFVINILRRVSEENQAISARNLNELTKAKLGGAERLKVLLDALEREGAINRYNEKTGGPQRKLISMVPSRMEELIKEL